MQRQLSAAALLLICVHIVNSRVIPLSKRAFSYIANDTVCVVDNAIYYDGDPIPTDDPCEFCRCRPPGFSCVLRECEMKPGCKAIRREGECCPEYQCGCEHNGNFFKDGDKIPIAESPCYSCYCQGSSITCALADCKFRFDCPPEYVKGDCCPRYDHCPPESSIFTRPPLETMSTTINETQISFESTTPFEVNDNRSSQTTKNTFAESTTISTLAVTSTISVDSDKKDSDQSFITTSSSVTSGAGSSEVFKSTTNNYEKEQITQETTAVTKIQVVDAVTESLPGETTLTSNTETVETADQKTSVTIEESKIEKNMTEEQTKQTTFGTTSSIFVTTIGTTTTNKDTVSSSERIPSSEVVKSTTVDYIEPITMEIITTENGRDVDTTLKTQSPVNNNSTMDAEDITSTAKSQSDNVPTTIFTSTPEEKTTFFVMTDENAQVNATRTTLESESIGNTKQNSYITVSTQKLEDKPVTELITDNFNVENETTLASKNATMKDSETEEPLEVLTEESQTTESVVNNNLSTGTASSMLT